MDIKMLMAGGAVAIRIRYTKYSISYQANVTIFVYIFLMRQLPFYAQVHAEEICTEVAHGPRGGQGRGSFPVQLAKNAGKSGIYGKILIKD